MDGQILKKAGEDCCGGRRSIRQQVEVPSGDSDSVDVLNRPMTSDKHLEKQQEPNLYTGPLIEDLQYPNIVSFKKKKHRGGETDTATQTQSPRTWKSVKCVDTARSKSPRKIDMYKKRRKLHRCWATTMARPPFSLFLPPLLAPPTTR